MEQVTVIGGGLAGLVSAIACAEAGRPVVLHEAHRTLGGRARSTAAPFIANDGPHVWYSDGEAWRWLDARGLVPAAKLSLAAAKALRFRHGGRLHRAPSAAVLKLAARRGLRAPVERSFREWVTEVADEDTARAASGMMGVVTFDHDPGRLSAAFVWERFLRVFTPQWPAVRYLTGGWEAMVQRMADLAEARGVRIVTGSRVDALPDGPVIVATDLAAARRLLGDEGLVWTSGRTAMLDLGLREGRDDQFGVFDEDEAGFFERYSMVEPSLAPAGHSLVQGQMPLRPGESKADGIARLEALFDLGLPGWRDRVAWRREQLADGRSGALDLPGTTWRDRPAIARGNDVYLVGDMTAAPGLLGEVALASALHAAGAITAGSRVEARA
jgi:phytoene dehydrogenase-like protein